MAYQPVAPRLHECEHCSCTFEATHRPRYCSVSCRQRAKDEARKRPCSKCGASMWAANGTSAAKPVCQPCRRTPDYEARMARKGRVQQWVCGSCGVACSRPSTRGNLPLYCVECRATDWVTPTLRRSLYERDGWICWLCQEGVDASLIGTRSVWRPSLDHVVPRSKGGATNEANLKLAHNWCNSVRRDDRVPAEMFRAAV